MNQAILNPQISRRTHAEQEALVSMDAMVASLSAAQQPSHKRLSPSKILGLTMFVLIILAVYNTYQRAMVAHDFLIIDDTTEVVEEEY